MAYSLRVLELYRNNISDLPTDYFDGCNMLQRLSLGNNLFTAIPNLTKISHTLVNLYMDDNRLSDIYEANFSRLELLDLVNNCIDSFPYPKWTWPLLRTLHLQENRMPAITPEWFWNAIEPLTLLANNNPWKCNRNLCWLNNCSLGNDLGMTHYKCGTVGYWV